MKYIYQLFIILVVTFVGELLHYFIPIPVPASIYGLIIMLILLCTKVVKLEHVERTSDFLIEIMPLMFIPGGVGLVTAWGDLKDMMLPVVVITIISTIVVMAVTGKATELIMKTGKKKEGVPTNILLTLQSVKVPYRKFRQVLYPLQKAYPLLSCLFYQVRPYQPDVLFQDFRLIL